MQPPSIAPAKPVLLPVKVDAASKTTLAERGGYTQSEVATPVLAANSVPKGSVDGNHPGKVTPQATRPSEGRRRIGPSE